MYLFECEVTFEAEPAQVWKVWTDVERWPEWDVSKEIARLDGPFQPGVSGWAKQRGNLGGSFTITVVDDGRRWVTECPVPMGKVIFDHVPSSQSPWDVSGWSRGPRCRADSGSLLLLLAPKMRRGNRPVPGCPGTTAVPIAHRQHRRASGVTSGQPVTGRRGTSSAATSDSAAVGFATVSIILLSSL